MAEIVCDICTHHCRLQQGQTGFCRARRNVNGVNTCDNYGRLTAIAMDPIEKKPLVRFYPGSKILSVGSYGCSLACPFCQNYSISMRSETAADYRYVSPEQLSALVLAHPESIGLAFTYNEPLISWEYIVDCARILKPEGKKIVIVSNGMVEQHILAKLMPYTDAMNIDLKGFTQAYYDWLGGDLAAAQHTIAAAVAAGVHVEVTTLVIPGRNDSPEGMATAAQWLASLSPDIPLHLSRYFPRYHCDIPSTPVATLRQLQSVAQRCLSHVYLGNV